MTLRDKRADESEYNIMAVANFKEAATHPASGLVKEHDTSRARQPMSQFAEPRSQPDTGSETEIPRSTTVPRLSVH